MFKKRKNDIVKIKEDALLTQENNLNDSLKSLDNQSKISYYAISLILIFITLYIRTWIFIEAQVYILFYSIILIYIGWYNILSTSVSIHTNTNPIFVNWFNNNYEDYLDNKHILLDKFYENTKKALYKKARINNILYFFTVILITLILLIFNYKTMSIQEWKIQKHHIWEKIDFPWNDDNNDSIKSWKQ